MGQNCCSYAMPNATDWMLARAGVELLQWRVLEGAGACEQPGDHRDRLPHSRIPSCCFTLQSHHRHTLCRSLSISELRYMHPASQLSSPLLFSPHYVAYIYIAPSVAPNTALTFAPNVASYVSTTVLVPSGDASPRSDCTLLHTDHAEAAVHSDSGLGAVLGVL